jgi:lipoprotein NlpD
MSNGVYHTVKPGQTLYRIAKTYDIEERELARVNDIDDPKKLKAGERLFIPDVSHVRHVPSTVATRTKTPTSSSSTAVKKGSSKKSVKTPQASVKQKSTTSRTTKKSTQSASAKPRKGLFIWPAKGKLVSKFGAKSDSTNKGIELSVASGSAVVAAAPGKVIYSGSGIRGYGNLIIIEHADDMFTVYGYNKKNLIKTNDFVSQGDKIAVAGVPQNSKSPRLHFEIRQGKRAVNPIFYLP